MGWQPTLYSYFGLGGAMLSLGVALTAYRYRDEPGVRPFVGLMLALCGWSLAYAVQLGFTTRAGQLHWQRAALTIGGTIPALWLLFTLEYAGKADWLTRRRKALLAIEPFAFGALTLTNDVHGLIWNEAVLSSGPGPSVVLLSLGDVYFAHIAYAYLLVTVGLGLLAYVFTRTSALYRRQTAALILGALPPFAANIAFTLRVDWGPMPALDFTPFAFVVTGVLFGLALFQFDLLVRAPIARQQVLDETGDGLAVLDTDGVIVDINQDAREIFAGTPAVGDEIDEIVAATPAFPDDSLDAVAGTTILRTVRGQQHAYDVQLSSLTDHHGQTVGTVLCLRDVTERNAYEQRLVVAQRVLRHNLRNDLNVILGWAEQIAAAASDGQAAAAREIIETTDELLDLSEKTRQMTALGEGETDHAIQVDLPALLLEIAADFREAYSNATVRCTVPENVRVTQPGRAPLEVALRNLVENALEHNDTDEPWVGLRVQRTADRVCIQVEDNGPGIPAIERGVLEEGSETPLDHGSGVGIWLTYWSITTLGGEITFADRDPRGSIVTVELVDLDGAAGDEQERQVQ